MMYVHQLFGGKFSAFGGEDLDGFATYFGHDLFDAAFQQNYKKH